MFGDIVLIQVVEFVNNSIRFNDTLFRYGGEEFVICFANTNNANVIGKLNVIREELSKLILSDGNGTTANVKASFGLSEYPNNGMTIKKLIECADNALYKSKENGRNQVTIYNNM